MKRRAWRSVITILLLAVVMLAIRLFLIGGVMPVKDALVLHLNVENNNFSITVDTTSSAKTIHGSRITTQDGVMSIQLSDVLVSPLYQETAWHYEGPLPEGVHTIALTDGQLSRALWPQAETNQ